MKVEHVYPVVETYGSVKPLDIFREVFEGKGYKLIGYDQDCMKGICRFHLVKENKNEIKKKKRKS